MKVSIIIPIFNEEFPLIDFFEKIDFLQLPIEINIFRSKKKYFNSEIPKSYIPTSRNWH